MWLTAICTPLTPRPEQSRQSVQPQRQCSPQTVFSRAVFGLGNHAVLHSWFRHSRSDSIKPQPCHRPSHRQLTRCISSILPRGRPPPNGVPLTLSGSGYNGFVGSGYVGGTLYGFTASGQEYSIDPATGIAIFAVNTNPLTPIIAARASQ